MNDRNMDHRFHDLCARLQRNEPSLNIITLTSSNQEQLTQLGRSLVGNTHLIYLRFHQHAPPQAFDNTEEDWITINEVTEALANGFRHSQVQKIRLTNLEFNVMQHILKAIRKAGTIRELFILLTFTGASFNSTRSDIKGIREELPPCETFSLRLQHA
jgi:hypothetical protein